MRKRGEIYKRGSHVSMIISFVIFITFVVFLFVILRPALSTDEEKEELLNYIASRVIDNSSSNLTIISVQINRTTAQNCISLQNLFLAMSSEIDYYYKAIVKNISEDILEANTDTTNIFDLKITRRNNNNGFFKIYFSPEFNQLTNTTSNCPSILETEYDIGSFATRKYVYERKINDLMESYREDYEGLKDSFNIPPGNEFGFGITYSNGTRAEVTQEIKGENIYVEEMPIQYINDKANILSGFINTEMW